MESINLANIEDIPKNARCCIYGTGQSSRMVLKGIALLRPDIQIPFLLDSFKEDHKYGFDVFTPNRLLEDNLTNLYDSIIIASGYSDVILETLKKLQITTPIYIVNSDLWGRLYLINFYEKEKYDSPFFNNISIEYCSTKCDMACRFCVRDDAPHMDEDLFKCIIDELAAENISKVVNLVGAGEPLIDPKTYKAIEYCSNKGIFTTTCTNGLSLNRQKYQRLVNSGLNRLTISLHNLSQESFYDRSPKNNKTFEEYYQNIMECIDYNVRKQIESEIHIRLMYDISKKYIASELREMPAMRMDTEHAMERFQKFLKSMQEIAEKNGVSCLLTNSTFSEAFNKLKQTGQGQFIQIMDNITLNICFLIIPGLSEQDQKKYQTIETSNGTCYSISTPSIGPNGEFKAACCLDHPLILGTISKDKSLISIINGKKYRAMVKGFIKNKLIMPECKKCKGTIVPI